jgi:hypothetical protein
MSVSYFDEYNVEYADAGSAQPHGFISRPIQAYKYF